MKKKEIIKYSLMLLVIVLAYILVSRAYNLVDQALKVWSWTKTQETMFSVEDQNCRTLVIDDYLSAIKCGAR